MVHGEVLTEGMESGGGCVRGRACCCTQWEANDRYRAALQRGSPAQPLWLSLVEGIYSSNLNWEWEHTFWRVDANTNKYAVYLLSCIRYNRMDRARDRERVFIFSSQYCCFSTKPLILVLKTYICIYYTDIQVYIYFDAAVMCPNHLRAEFKPERNILCIKILKVALTNLGLLKFPRYFLSNSSILHNSGNLKPKVAKRQEIEC